MNRFLSIMFSLDDDDDDDDHRGGDGDRSSVYGHQDYRH